MAQVRVLEAFAAALLEDDPQALYDRAPCGYLSTTADGTVVKANATFATLTGYPADDLVGRRLGDLVSPGGRIYLETHYAPLLQLRGEVSELALDLLRADGTRLPVLLNARLDRDGQGRPAVVRLAVFDATERRRYERELLLSAEEAQRARRAAEEAERHSRALVDTLQDTLVPRSLPEVAGLDLGGVYRPAGDGQEVGGDFYDAFLVEDGECWVVLGDVSGKGVDAAVVTALVRNGARALATALPAADRTPAEVLRRLDRLIDHHETQRFCTAAVVRLRRRGDGWVATYASGGHPPLVLRRAGTGRSRLVECQGQLLGVLPRVVLAERELELGPCDTLVLYTDGVTEGRAPDGDLYGEQRLLATLDRIHGDASAVAAGLVDDVLAFQGGYPCDDIACIAVGVR